MTDSPALAALGVSVNLGARRVLDAIDIAADYGSMLAVLGPNGAGKTTLLRVLAGLVPFAGEVTLAGRNIRELEPRERSRLLAFVPQRTLSSARMLVRTIVGHGRYAHVGGLRRFTPHDEAAIDRAMVEADVSEFASRTLPELSHGEQRRVLIARALATEARVLVLDEPAAALDVSHTLGLYALLQGLARAGYCVVLALHQLDDALRFCDRALLLEGGRPIAHGATRDVITEQHVRDVYGVRLVRGAALGFEALSQEGARATERQT